MRILKLTICLLFLVVVTRAQGWIAFNGGRYLPDTGSGTLVQGYTQSPGFFDRIQFETSPGNDRRFLLVTLRSGDNTLVYGWLNREAATVLQQELSKSTGQ